MRYRLIHRHQESSKLLLPGGKSEKRERRLMWDRTEEITGHPFSSVLISDRTGEMTGHPPSSVLISDRTDEIPGHPKSSVPPGEEFTV
jgi:hypothetical protein